MGIASAIRAGRAFVEVFLDNNPLLRGLNVAESRLKGLGSRLSGFGSKAFGGGLPEPFASLQRFATSPAGLFSGMLVAVHKFAEGGDTIAKMGRRTGASAEFLSEMGFAANRSGTDLDTLETGLRKMSKALVSAGEGSKEAQDTFARLGLSAADLLTKKPDEQFTAIAEALSRIKNPSIQAAIALELFGKSGTKLLPLVQGGAAGIAELREEARRLGLTMSSESALNAEALTDALYDLGRVLKKIVGSIGGALAPEITGISRALAPLIANVSRWIKENKSVVVTIFGVSAAVVGAGIGLSILGGSVIRIGAPLGAASKALAIGLSAVSGALGFLLSPFSLIAAAAAVAAYAFFRFTQAGQTAWSAVSSAVRTLVGDVSGAMTGIGDALAAGDLTAAWAVVTTTLKLEWARVTVWFREKWESLKEWFFQNFPSIALALNETIAAIRSAWAEMCGWLQKKWVDFTNSMFTETVASGMADWFATSEKAEAKRVTAWRKAGVGEEEIARRQGGEWGKNQDYYDKLLAGGKGRWEISGDDIRKTLHEQMEENRKRAANDKASIDADTKRRRDEIESARQRWAGNIAAGTDVQGRDELTQMQAALEQSKREAQEARDKAKAARIAAAAQNAPKSKDGGPDLEGLTQKQSIAGTFSGEALFGLGGGGTLERIERNTAREAEAAEETARNTARIGEGPIVPPDPATIASFQ